MMILFVCLIATLNSFSSSAPINEIYSKFVSQPTQLTTDDYLNGEIKFPLNRVARHVFGGYEGLGYSLPSKLYLKPILLFFNKKGRQ